MFCSLEVQNNCHLDVRSFCGWSRISKGVVDAAACRVSVFFTCVTMTVNLCCDCVLVCESVLIVSLRFLRTWSNCETTRLYAPRCWTATVCVVKFATLVSISADRWSEPVCLWLYQASLATGGIMFSGVTFICNRTCENDSLKTIEPITMQIGASSSRARVWNSQLWGSWGQRSRSHEVSLADAWVLTPLGWVARPVCCLWW